MRVATPAGPSALNRPGSPPPGPSAPTSAILEPLGTRSATVVGTSADSWWDIERVVCVMRATAMIDEGRVEHRGHGVWWGRAGASVSPQAAPLLTIHGGPGICHDCLEPLAALARIVRSSSTTSTAAGAPIAPSTRTSTTSSCSWRSRCRPREPGSGQSAPVRPLLRWRPAAGKYLLQHQPVGVLSVTLSNSFASTQGLSRGWDRRLAELPDGDGAARGPVPTPTRRGTRVR